MSQQSSALIILVLRLVARVAAASPASMSALGGRGAVALTRAPALVVVEPFGPDHDVVETPAAPPGAVELAVAVDLDKLGHLPAGSLAFGGGRAGDGAGDGRPRVTEFGLAAPAA
jgi:hypothetical protein